MTREDQIRKARELRAEGWTAPEIAEELGANESTVRNWYLGGVCRCGALLDGGSGRKSSIRCGPCAAVDRTIWTKELLIEKIKAWAAIFGWPPSAMDWDTSMIRRHPDLTAAMKARKVERWEKGEWPYSHYVTHRFGSWSAGLRAAGFEPNPTGAHGRWEQVAA